MQNLQELIENISRKLNKRIAMNDLQLYKIARTKKELVVLKNALPRIHKYVETCALNLGYPQSVIDTVISQTKIQFLDKPMESTTFSLKPKEVLASYFDDKKTIFIVLQNDKIPVQILLHEYGHALYYTYFATQLQKAKTANTYKIQVLKVLEEYSAKLMEKTAQEIIGLDIEWRLEILPKWLIEHIHEMSESDKSIDSVVLYSWTLDYRHAFAVLALEDDS